MPRLPPELSAQFDREEENALAHIAQFKNIAEIDSIGCVEWTVIYEYDKNYKADKFFYSAILNKNQTEAALSRKTWDLSVGQGTPSFTQRHDMRGDITTYDRFGMDNVEPLVYFRNFHGIKPDQFDLSEEFRLFHNLYFDKNSNNFIYIDGRGNEVIVAEIGDKKVRVLTSFLKKYLAARQMNLAVFFDHRANSDLSLLEVNNLAEPVEFSSKDRCYSLGFGDGIFSGKTFSRLLGKKIIYAPPIEACGVWPYEDAEKKEYKEFIVGIDAEGSLIKNTCDPDCLANYFGSNEESSHYLTPVWFSRDVLEKYYNNPGKYSVEDGYVRCGSLWGIQIDNNIPDHVMVYLGDLGRDLSSEEQGHWVNYNLTPSDRTPSKVNFERSFNAKFSIPSEPDLLFKYLYQKLNEKWMEKNGWHLFREIHSGDEHIIKQVRLLFSNNLGEFDHQILFLVKLLIDYLNESQLVSACGGALPDEKGIGKLDRYLTKYNYPHRVRDIKLLRLLQNLRSSGAAHAKGGRFDRVHKDIGLDKKSAPEVFREIMEKINKMLNDIHDFFFNEDD
ncbi:hypothetical protein AD947_00660 [Acetobacter tropicalis]|uniref:Uncharacterized protein n=1 Tax=Acetobacter tropicalis TaxID=104102 RepID=A0A149U7S4_9PROT|nr:hypothetical protein AD947_00660 [Acetobacter tropicalis]